MKYWIISVAVIIMTFGCSTVPRTPPRYENTYAVQVLSVDVPSLVQQDTLKGSETIEAFIKRPDATVYEYPTVYAAVGQSALRDETHLMSMAEDYSVIDGKVIPKEKVYTIGRSCEIRIIEAKEKAVTYHLNVNYQELIGFDTFKLAGNVEVKIPVIEGKTIDTEITQTLESWTVLGGIQNTSNGDDEKSSSYFLVRVLPPK